MRIIGSGRAFSIGLYTYIYIYIRATIKKRQESLPVCPSIFFMFHLRRRLLRQGVLTNLYFSRAPHITTQPLKRPMSSKGNWNPNLTPEQLAVLRDKGTERPNTGAYLHNKEEGIYSCANCGAELYKSSTKFDSGCGWPSFYEEIAPGTITYSVDNSLPGRERTEICCAKCGGHLGHVFKGEGWKEALGIPKDVRHCVNSLSLSFKGKKTGGE